MRLTRAEKEQLESVGIQCIQISEDSPTEQALKENVRKFNEIRETIDPLLSLVVDISGITTEYPSKGKSMLGVKSDCDIPYLEKQYLISKGWDARLFE